MGVKMEKKRNPFLVRFKFIWGSFWGSILETQLGDPIWPKFGLLAKIGLTWPKRNETGRSGSTSGGAVKMEKTRNPFLIHFRSILGPSLETLRGSILGTQLGDFIWPKFRLLAKMGLTWPKRNETG